MIRFGIAAFVVGWLMGWYRGADPFVQRSIPLEDVGDVVWR